MALSWAEFEASAPALAAPGAALLLRFGPGLGYLATVRKDGGPRLHPVCPLLAAGGLYVFVIGRSPKRFDLERDGRFALHSFPAPDDDDQFYCAGTAAGVTDAALRARLATVAAHAVADDEVLFELRLERALHTTWENPRRPDARPVHSKWSAS